MAVIEFPAPADRVGIVDAVEAAAVEPVQGQAILDPMRPALARLNALYRDLDPITAGKLEFEAVQAKQRLKIVADTSYQDLMFKSKPALCFDPRAAD